MSTLPLQVRTLEDGHKTILKEISNIRSTQTSNHRENKEDRAEDRRFFQKIVDEMRDEIKDLTTMFNDDRIANAKRSGAIGVITAIVSAFALKAAEHLIK
jgi:hypothetical protein